MEKLTIATGLSARSKSWKTEEITWAAMAKRLHDVHRTGETLKTYQAANKEDRGKIKDIGGYVGGYLRGGRRKPENLVYRSLITLDLDYATPDVWANFTLLYGCAAILHSTHSHTADKPKYRLIIPLSRQTGSEEYAAVSRSIAGTLGIELFDPTGFQPYRLMFWPSCSVDAEFYIEEQQGPALDVDAILASYVDWTDSTLWPTTPVEDTAVRDLAAKQQDPEDKKGIIGAFCRTYDIHSAIDTFLSDKYDDAKNGRYTYNMGSTAGGLVTYADKWAYSHHGTDPTSGQLCNAFDLVRIHLFGDLDTSPNSKVSLRAMEEKAVADGEVRKTIAAESLDAARFDFADGYEAPESEDGGVDWAAELEVDTKGNHLNSANNMNLIFTHDPNLKNKFRRNEFDSKKYLFDSVPWRLIASPEPIRDIDYAGVRNYFDSVYGIVGSAKIDDAMALDIEKRTFHPVREYLVEAKKGWDGAERVDTLLIDYFGVEDNIYTREAIRKSLVGAVARVRRPGVKFDFVLTLVGEQGDGKSTFVSNLGGPWFSDSFSTVSGKESFEQLQGKWIIEIAELAGFRKSEADAVKHFISKTVDTFRPAFGRTVEDYPRQCIFIGTTNNRGFLKDATGARRFLPIDVVSPKATKDVHEDMTPEEVAQIWGEAVAMYEAGEPLYMIGESETIAKAEQRLHQEEDERAGFIIRYLDTPLPADWPKRDLYERRLYLDNVDSDDVELGEDTRQTVCVAQIWCECLGLEKKDMVRNRTNAISDILRALPEWEPVKKAKRFKIYGVQKYYKRKGN